MATIEVNGVAIHVARLAAAGEPASWGRARTVVCLHGIGTDSLASYYFTVAKPFSDAGMDVVMYDLRGHGRSGRPSSGYTLTEFVDDLVGLLAALGVSEPVYLVGNSFGGTVAFSYAARHPGRVAALVVIESEPASAAWSVKMAANLGLAATQLRHPEAFAWLTSQYGVRRSRLARGAARLLGATTLAADIPAGPVLTAAQVAAIRCPVLAIYGADSDLVGQRPPLSELLPDCSTVVIAGQGHSVLVETPDRVADVVLDWFAGVGP